jgi:hypothetical protein
VLTIFVIARTARLFRSLGGESQVVENEGFRPVQLLAGGYSPPNLWPGQLLAAVILTLCAECAVTASIANSTLIATVLAGISAALWAGFFTSEKYWSNGERRSALRVGVKLLLVIVVTAASLLPYLKRAGGYGGRGLFFAGRTGPQHSLLGLFLAGRSPRQHLPRSQAGQVPPDGAIESAGSGLGNAYSGIVLWPKKQTVTTLVAPAPIIGRYKIGPGRRVSPLAIPFSGVYWFFQAPDGRPPRGSRESQGSPELVTARSTDLRPLLMEAHQNLGTFIDLNCCSRIQVAIRNTDRYPETVSLELILTDTSLPKKHSESLGAIMVKSTRPWKLYGDRPAVSEILNFEIPAHPAIRRFDEVTVIFRLDPARAVFGAKTGIERFVLVPRGL